MKNFSIPISYIFSLLWIHSAILKFFKLAKSKCSDLLAAPCTPLWYGLKANFQTQVFQKIYSLPLQNAITEKLKENSLDYFVSIQNRDCSVSIQEQHKLEFALHYHVHEPLTFTRTLRRGKRRLRAWHLRSNNELNYYFAGSWWVVWYTHVQWMSHNAL